MKKLFLVVPILLFGIVFSACTSDADTASYNISKEADRFNVLRRIVFYNGISGEYMLVMEGYCSLGNNDPVGELTVTCETDKGQYKKHFLGLSDNVTYFAEQIKSENVSKDHYKVIFRPKEILPDIDIDL